MNSPSLPTGYDVSKRVLASRSDCQLTVGFDRYRSHIPRFLVQLWYRTGTDPVEWTAIARMDHNETSATGHDVYREGLHVDIDRRSNGPVHLHLAHGPLPESRGVVVRGCVDYLDGEAEYFVGVFEERRPPGAPPGWSDGGSPTRGFIRPNRVRADMSHESPAEEALSMEELTTLLAEAEDTTPEAIERGADDLEIAPPEEATVIDD